jgi:predicted nucleic acid-binding protein
VDTDVFSWIAFQRQRHREFGELVRGHILAVSFSTVGELWAGAERANWGDARRQALDDILRQYVVLPATEAVARHWGRLHARFKDQFESNDMWTASCALAQPHPLPIATGNLKHFQPMAADFRITLVHPDL